jgi:hypothetical protein
VDDGVSILVLIGYGRAGCGRKKVPMELLIVVIILILLFGGGFSFYRR